MENDFWFLFLKKVEDINHRVCTDLAFGPYFLVRETAKKVFDGIYIGGVGENALIFEHQGAVWNRFWGKFVGHFWRT